MIEIINLSRNMSKNLYLFTAEYPYNKKENFLEDEINYLAGEFDSITIYPLSARGLLRPTPSNCKVDDGLCKGKLLKKVRAFVGIYRALPFYWKEYFNKGVYKSWSKTKSMLLNMLVCSYYMHSANIRSLKRNLKKNDVVYFYWGVAYNTIAPFFKGRAKLISRFHGDWDLWTPTGEEGYKPQRQALLSSLDCAVFISSKGRDFFQRIYPKVATKVFHLGSRDIGIVRKSKDGVLRIVSCSTVYPLKRVPLIFQSVCCLTEQRVKWTHLGGGVDFEKLKKMVKSHPDNIDVELTGYLTLDQVFEYYYNNPVDLFVNLSTNEGVPVSIMEAISQDIPVVATNVGGNSEIVTEETGCLVSANPTPDEVKNAILKVVNAQGLKPRTFWKREFCAEKNYLSFAKFISKEL